MNQLAWNRAIFSEFKEPRYGKNRMKCRKHDGAALEILLGVQINREI